MLRLLNMGPVAEKSEPSLLLHVISVSSIDISFDDEEIHNLRKPVACSFSLYQSILQ